KSRIEDGRWKIEDRSRRRTPFSILHPLSSSRFLCALAPSRFVFSTPFDAATPPHYRSLGPCRKIPPLSSKNFPPSLPSPPTTTRALSPISSIELSPNPSPSSSSTTAPPTPPPKSFLPFPIA